LRLLGRYIFREVVSSAVLGTLLATFVVFLQKLDQLFKVLVGSNAEPRTVLALLLWALPPVLPLTIPFGVLVGILIGLGRLAGDGEIIAMRAAGVSSRKVILPVLLFASLGLGIAAFSSLRLAPLAMRQSTEIMRAIEATKISADIEPRIFDENFPNHILYVGEVKPGDAGQAGWSPVFLADVTAPEQRSSGMKAKADGPMITVAKEAIAVSDPRNNRIELSLKGVATHEMGKDGVSNDSESKASQQVLDAKPPSLESFTSYSMNTRELLRYRGPEWVEMGIELHRRFAFPVACLVLAIVGIPLGIGTRKGGKSAGYVNAIFLAFFCYYGAWIWLTRMARTQLLPIPVAAWLPNAVLGAMGLVFMIRMERPGDSDMLDGIKRWFGLQAARFQRKDDTGESGRWTPWKVPLLPQIVDTYMLTNFLFYLVVVAAGLVSLILMYNFFELMANAFKNSTFSTLLTYLLFLTPQLIYDTLPLSALVAVLANFGVLSKNNEIIAFKACGVSLYRLALPVVLGSILCSGALFAFDFSYLPRANHQQEKLRDEILGRAKKTYQQTDHTWIMGRSAPGQPARIYYYNFYDTSANQMNGVNVFELDPGTFALTREISAARALWSPSLRGGSWIFEDGWSCVYKGPGCDVYGSFQGKTQTFPELVEGPNYFLTEAVQDKQMNFLELNRYVENLKQRGYNATRFQVQYYRKFAMPLAALVLAMIAVPFGFMVGSRGAMTGIGVSLVIGMAYRGTEPLFASIGNAGLLDPALAAWAPDAIFALVGMYFLLRMRS
jgi:LPS export ABC transporter permease LptG/LPS export ABC transporter permease LptF